MIEFAYPGLLVLLVLPWLVWRFFPAHREQVSATRLPFFHDITTAIGTEPREGSVVMHRKKIEMILATVIWILLVLAVARPEKIGELTEQTRAARDIILAIDISGSMDERDFNDENGNPLQRLQVVKNVVGEFIRERQGDRVALIVFGSKAFIQSPFTEDLTTLDEMLQQTQVGMAGPHTVMGDAIGLAIRTFEASDIEQRLLILLSDGTDTGSRMSPVNAAEIAASRNVEIHTVAVGNPEGEGDYKLDVKTLRSVASRADGQFFFANDQTGLAQVYQRIEQLSPRQIEVLSYRQKEQLAHIPLALALIIAIAGIIWLRRAEARQKKSDTSGVLQHG